MYFSPEHNYGLCCVTETQLSSYTTMPCSDLTSAVKKVMDSIWTKKDRLKHADIKHPRVGAKSVLNS